MTQQTNIGQAFPLESLGSDIARNSYNYQSILNALIEWNTTAEDTVMVRITKDSAPWFQDFEIPSKKSVFSVNTNTSYQMGQVGSNHFSITSQMHVTTYGGTDGDVADPGDVLTVRIAMKNSGNTSWQAYFTPLITEWVDGISVRKNNFFTYMGNLYVATENISPSLVPPNADLVNFKLHQTQWVVGTEYNIGDYVYYTGGLYIVTTHITSAAQAPGITGEYELVAGIWTSAVKYEVGAYVIYSGDTYLCKNTVTSTASPDVDSDNWTPMTIIKVPVVSSTNLSGIFRWYTTVDATSIIYKNVGDISTPSTEFYIQNSVKTIGDPSIYERSTAVFSSSNMSFFPTDITPVWYESAPVSETDDTITIDKRQPYSAVMVFDHTNQKDCKTINFINYDGPDLDQGLCIYLPIQSELVGGEIVEPEDAFTYEFYFRIWPTTKYTADTVTRDHIVNKAQIYVYNAIDANAVAENNCSTPIAKFSMARMTNFYMFAENVTIPDKPVVYRATFMYSKPQRAWILHDYYQLPDHVFVGPVGFIDPQNPANPDYNSPELSNINPNATHIGYETCAFPTYVDVFSNPDLRPYKSSDGTFYNRSI